MRRRFHVCHLSVDGTAILKRDPQPGANRVRKHGGTFAPETTAVAATYVGKMPVRYRSSSGCKPWPHGLGVSEYRTRAAPTGLDLQQC